MNTRTVGNQIVQVPNILSVDDHVMEPPDLWTTRLPEQYRDSLPHVVREKGQRVGKNLWQADEEGEWADIWHFEAISVCLTMELAAAGYSQGELTQKAMLFEEMRRGCYIQKERLADMTLDHVDASVCFPNVISRFCGQTFSEAKDKDLGLLCVQAYNDWMIDEWCAGDGRGRLIPLTMIPLWDPELAAVEIRRCAAKGSHAVAFSESPFALGYDSVNTGAWDPFFAACDETETTVCIHIGSSSRVAETSPDAKYGEISPVSYQYGMHSLVDIVLSGVLERYPTLRIAYSEANIGWMPYIMQRMDILWDRRKKNPYGHIALKDRPSSYVRDRIYGCIVDDAVGVRTSEFGIGMNQITFESDYPHGASSFPNSIDLAADICVSTKLSDSEIYNFMRGNAIRAFRLEQFGVSA